MDPERLKAMVERYNEICDAGYDWDFGKDPTTLGSPAKAATQGWIAAHEIMGLPIDDKPENVPYRNKNLFE